VLYVGKAPGAGGLRKRIGRLAWIATENAKSHHNLIETWGMFDLGWLVDRKRLFVQWYACDDPDREEGLLLRRYKAEFGDLPPANLALGTKGESD
jgi:hypothetical protein